MVEDWVYREPDKITDDMPKLEYVYRPLETYLVVLWVVATIASDVVMLYIGAKYF